MLIVTVLVITDYARLRRRLEASVDASPVSVVLRAEASVARVWTANRRQVNADITGEFALRMRLRAELDLEEAKEAHTRSNNGDRFKSPRHGTMRMQTSWRRIEGESTPQEPWSRPRKPKRIRPPTRLPPLPESLPKRNLT